jgi:alpha-L-fucosidase
VYAFLLMRPYEAVTVRGVPIRRVRAVRDLGSGRALEFTLHCAILDRFTSPDPAGEIRVVVPESAVDPLATALEIEIAPL